MDANSTTREMDRTLDEFAANGEVREIFDRLSALQRRAEQDGTWDTMAGRRAETVRGHLMMALDAAGAAL